MDIKETIEALMNRNKLHIINRMMYTYNIVKDLVGTT